MISTFFNAFASIFSAAFGWLETMWSSVGNFLPIFLGIFGSILAYRFVLRPIIGGQNISGVDGFGNDKPITEPRYGKTGQIDYHDAAWMVHNYDWSDM